MPFEMYYIVVDDTHRHIHSHTRGLVAKGIATSTQAFSMATLKFLRRCTKDKMQQTARRRLRRRKDTAASAPNVSADGWLTPLEKKIGTSPVARCYWL